MSKAAEAMQLHKEAMRMLNTMEQTCTVKAVFRLMDANADGDDLILEGKRFPLLRQQTHVHATDPYLCLSDFVRPLSQGIPDTVGAFATTTEDILEKNLNEIVDAVNKSKPAVVKGRVIDKVYLSSPEGGIVDVMSEEQ